MPTANCHPRGKRKKGISRQNKINTNVTCIQYGTIEVLTSSSSSFSKHLMKLHLYLPWFLDNILKKTNRLTTDQPEICYNKAMAKVEFHISPDFHMSDKNDGNSLITRVKCEIKVCTW